MRSCSAQNFTRARRRASRSADAARYLLGSFLDFRPGEFHPPAARSFDAKYSGPNSFLARERTRDIAGGDAVHGLPDLEQLEILADIESAGGAGLSNALGIAGFTNVDVVRNPTLGEAPYVSRVMLHYTIPIGKETTEATRNPLSLASTVPVRRLELRFGKMSTVDFFDLNSVGSDSHLQFMNWAVVNNGALRLRRGHARLHLRLGGGILRTSLGRALRRDADADRGQRHHARLEHRARARREFRIRVSSRSASEACSVIVRALGFVNHANMGSYREAIDGYLVGQGCRSRCDAHTAGRARVKYGFGLNAEQELTAFVARLRTSGMERRGATNPSPTRKSTGRRKSARISAASRGIAPRTKSARQFVANGISGDHRRYLALGGYGFILGDGGLNYGLEKIFETYYTAHVWRGISVAVDYQHVTNPGYNRDRGPANVFSFRIHVEDAIPFDKFGKR